MGPPPIGFFFPGDNNPAEQISWDDFQGFEAATRLGLPTEAQWEYACRAGTPGSYSGTGNLDDMGWYRDNSDTGNGLETHPVGQKQPNHFGLHDMHGNVAEWCFYSKGPGAQVIRGGGWSFDAQDCRSAHRGYTGSPARNAALGFRPIAPTP